ncbi:MAG TPA: polysaccharide pyruvyl transferase family protein [Planctomycetota bacterium]|nr:polysaccharide pyruvyl transferase family protein [Planctomycetota bacterium]
MRKDTWEKTDPPLEGDVRLVNSCWTIPRRPDDGFLRTKLLTAKNWTFPRWAFRRVRHALLRRRRPGFAELRGLLLDGEFLDALADADAVISTGGHHVTTLLVPDLVTPILVEMALALLMQKPLVLWSQSVGPLRFTCAENRDFTRAVLREALEIHVRDEQSLRELEDLGVGLENVRQTHDSVFGLDDVLSGYVPPSAREPVAGVSVYGIMRRPPEWQQVYVQALTDVVNRMIGDGLYVRFFTMERADGPGDDRPVIRRILDGVGKRERCEIVEDLEATEHLRQVARCRIFIGHKTHSVIMALAAATPVLSLAYHVKTEYFAQQFGVSEYCVPDTELAGDRILHVYEKECTALDAISRHLLERSREIGRIVRNDFAGMLQRIAAR